MTDEKETEKETKEDDSIELGSRMVGKIVLPEIDIKPYIGKKVKIEKVTEHEGQYGFYIKVIGELVATVGEGDKAIEIRPSRIFGLHIDDEKNIGWSDKTELGVYLEKMKVETYKDLVGKEVVCQSRTSKKTKIDYLTFN